MIYWREYFDTILRVYAGAVWWLISLVNLDGVASRVLAVIRDVKAGDADDVAAVRCPCG